jgi:hypothetical protein
MIRLTGYYKSDPTPYEDSIANHLEEGYFHNAYLFLQNGKYLRASKRAESKQLDFSRLDFNPDFPNKYEIKDKKLEMFFETGTKWEFSEFFEIVSPEELKGKEKTLRFVNW